MMLRAKILDQDPGAELRTAERRVLRLSVSLSTVDSGIDALIHDLSHTGLRIETGASLSVGEELLVDLPDDNRIEARVVWNKGKSYGCEFLSPIPKGVFGATVLRAPFEIPPAANSFRIQEIALGSQVDANDLAQWYADFESRKSASGEQLVGFRNDPDGQIVALVAKLN